MEYRISFREMSLLDLPLFLEIRNECRNQLHDNTLFTLQQAIDWFNKTSPKFFVIELDNNMIGYFRTSNWEKDSAYIGADIHKDFRGKGIGYYSYKLFTEYLKNKYSLSKLKLEVLSTNYIAKGLYEKLGFVVKRIHKNKVYRNDVYVDSVEMELLLENNL